MGFGQRLRGVLVVSCLSVILFGLSCSGDGTNPTTDPGTLKDTPDTADKTATDDGTNDLTDTKSDAGDTGADPGTTDPGVADVD
ncbi:MAG: hypothetical protein CMH54_15175, partial [Myxococcales bacterium]|nr:hypothetical protein [Myxococcales bacterium]